MTKRPLLILSLTLGLAVGAAALAQQRDRAPSPFKLGGPPEITSTDLDALFEATDATPPAAESWDSVKFIDDGKTTADEAIEALSAEREELLERLAKVEAELARWNAIGDALASAKDAKPPSGPESRTSENDDLIIPLPAATPRSRPAPTESSPPLLELPGDE